ncbi:MAG: biopolymer transporter ExbB [Vicingaceae bacterium]|nr:MAG: biopolymer transporter ExbB [Vicingaceae bacterium]
MKLPVILQIQMTGDSLGAVAEVSRVETISVWELIMMGGWYIMIPMGLMSMFAVYIIIERMIAINKAQKEDPNFMMQIKDYILDGKIESALNLCKMNQSPVARMVEKGISRFGRPLNDIKTAIENTGKLEVAKLEKSLSWLATISGAAPMLGFLGTVLGMIKTFHDMYTAGNEVEIANLAGGIMQAMVTTATGLVIGIIAYVGYNVLVARVERVVYKLEARIMEFMDLLNEPVK